MSTDAVITFNTDGTLTGQPSFTGTQHMRTRRPGSKSSF
jgi:hypothetical protein